MKIHPSVTFSEEALAEVCRRWKIVRLEVFGSVLREDFREDSDIDVLVTFAEDARTTLLDMVAIQRDFEVLFGREIDIMTRRSVESSRNYIFRGEVLRNTAQLYAA